MTRTKEDSNIKLFIVDSTLSKINRNKISRFLTKQESRVPLCSKISGSFTLEMAMTFPIVLSIIIFFLSFFRVMEVQIGINKVLGDTAITLSSYKESNELVADVVFRSKLVKEDLPIKSCAIHFVPVAIDKDNLELKVVYSMPIPFSYFKLNHMYLVQQVKVKKFTGWEEDDQGNIEEEEWVYVTKYGEVYHVNANCSHLKVTVIKCLASEIDTKRNNSGQQYKPCHYCSDKVGKWVYYTPEGDCYHGRIDCGALVRDVRRIPLSEAKEMGLRPCQDCSREDSGEDGGE